MAEIEIPQPEEMHEKAENPFMKRVALFVAISAVGLAISGYGGKNVSNAGQGATFIRASMLPIVNDTWPGIPVD